MTEQELDKLEFDLARYVAWMAPHHKARDGGKLILRAFEALKSMRAPEPPIETKCATFSELQAFIQAEKERLTSGGFRSRMKDGPDSGPPAGSADPGNKTEV